MDHAKDTLTPAQQREARRKIRRKLGGDTPEEQAMHLIRRSFERAARRRTRQGAVNAVLATAEEWLRAYVKSRKL